MEIFVRKYLNEQGIKTVEGLAQHIIELKRNTVVPKIVFELVDLLVNNKDCLLSFFAENKLLDELFKRETVKLKQPPFLRDDFRLIDLWAIETPLGEDLSHWLDASYLNQTSNTSKEAHQAWQDRWTKSMTGDFEPRPFDFNDINKARQEKVKIVLDDMVGKDGFYVYSNPTCCPDVNKFTIVELAKKNQQMSEDFAKAGAKSGEAHKETEGKLFYELDWSFITQMAERMSSNKKEGKYEMYNWKRPMTPKGVTNLKQATMRHLLEVMDGRYEDDGREFGHLEAISDNMMMINYQLKNVK